jgi:prepilin-type N-terminal cleavage/methylation domain-containing protein/prepilin-type processing-associated H-X9-DG protein
MVSPIRIVNEGAARPVTLQGNPRSDTLGFTLIELLVVIAIIALLMGILMPVLGRAREQGRAVYCLSSLRQIGLAVQGYAQEYNGFVPRAMDHPVKWPLAFMPFLGERNRKIQDYRKVKAYQCPSFPPNGVGVNGASNREQTIDYVVNAWDMDNPGLGTSNRGQQEDNPSTLQNVKRPSQRVYLADNEAGNWRPVIRDRYELDMVSRLNILDVWSVTHLPLSNQTSSGTNLHRRVARDRHRRTGCNNLFFDGHSDWLKAEDNTSRYWCGVEAGTR